MNEVKRQAMSELQKAVSDAERKAHEMISAERSKMERALAEAKRQASEDALTVINQQEDSSEVSITDPPNFTSFSLHLASKFQALSISVLVVFILLCTTNYPSICCPTVLVILFFVLSVKLSAFDFFAATCCHHYFKSSPVVCIY